MRVGYLHPAVLGDGFVIHYVADGRFGYYRAYGIVWFQAGLGEIVKAYGGAADAHVHRLDSAQREELFAALQQLRFELRLSHAAYADKIAPILVAGLDYALADYVIAVYEQHHHVLNQRGAGAERVDQLFLKLFGVYQVAVFYIGAVGNIDNFVLFHQRIRVQVGRVNRDGQSFCACAERAGQILLDNAARGIIRHAVNRYQQANYYQKSQRIR